MITLKVKIPETVSLEVEDYQIQKLPPVLQNKYAEFDPAEVPQQDILKPDHGYEGLSQVEIKVNPVSSTYVGSGIPRKSAADLTASGAAVTAPAGYYSESASKSVQAGTVENPVMSKGTVTDNQVDVYADIHVTEGYVPEVWKSGFATVKASELVSGSLNVTQNGTVDVTNYASAVVNVSGGGGSSSWTKIAEKSYQITYTGTSATTQATWTTGHSEIWTSEKWVYVRIRDTEGIRTDYFYGSDNFFCLSPQQYHYSSSTTDSGRFILRKITGDAHATAGAQANSTGYGVYADTIYSDGRIRIRKRYNSSYGKIDSTYKVEVYLLDPPTGAPIFE